jgi:Phage tail lysozyme/Chaperone of endosialidase
MGQKGGTTQQTSSSSGPPPQVMAEYQGLVDRATNVANQPYQPYTGEQVAPLSSQTLSGLGGISQYSGAAQPYLGAAGAMTMGASAPVNPAQFQGMGSLSPFMNPFTSSVVDTTQAEMNNQNQQQAQFLNSANISSGAFGGDRAGIGQAILANQQQLAEAPTIAGLNQANFSQAMQDWTGQQGVNLAAQQANRSAQLAGGAQLGQIGLSAQQAGLQGAQAETQAGMIPQQEQQAIDTAAQQMYQQGQAYPFTTTGWLGNIIEGVGGQSGGQSQTTSPGPNSITQGLGAATQGLGLLTSAIPLLSDERAKENVEEIGKTYDGQNIYRYNYKGDPRTQIGLIAQEEAYHDPGSVQRVGMGDLLGIDYERATDDAADRGHFSDGGAPDQGPPPGGMTQGVTQGAGQPRPPPQEMSPGQTIMWTDPNAGARMGMGSFGLLGGTSQHPTPETALAEPSHAGPPPQVPLGGGGAGLSPLGAPMASIFPSQPQGQGSGGAWRGGRQGFQSGGTPFVNGNPAFGVATPGFQPGVDPLNSLAGVNEAVFGEETAGSKNPYYGLDFDQIEAISGGQWMPPQTGATMPDFGNLQNSPQFGAAEASLAGQFGGAPPAGGGAGGTMSGGVPAIGGARMPGAMGAAGATQGGLSRSGLGDIASEYFGGGTGGGSGAGGGSGGGGGGFSYTPGSTGALAPTQPAAKTPALTAPASVPRPILADLPPESFVASHNNPSGSNDPLAGGHGGLARGGGVDMNGRSGFQRGGSPFTTFQPTANPARNPPTYTALDLSHLFGGGQQQAPRAIQIQRQLGQARAKAAVQRGMVRPRVIAPDPVTGEHHDITSQPDHPSTARYPGWPTPGPGGGGPDGLPMTAPRSVANAGQAPQSMRGPLQLSSRGPGMGYPARGIVPADAPGTPEAGTLNNAAFRLPVPKETLPATRQAPLEGTQEWNKPSTSVEEPMESREFSEAPTGRPLAAPRLVGADPMGQGHSLLAPQSMHALAPPSGDEAPMWTNDNVELPGVFRGAGRGFTEARGGRVPRYYGGRIGRAAGGPSPHWRDAPPDAGRDYGHMNTDDPMHPYWVRPGGNWTPAPPQPGDDDFVTKAPPSGGATGSWRRGGRIGRQDGGNIPIGGGVGNEMDPKGYTGTPASPDLSNVDWSIFDQDMTGGDGGQKQPDLSGVDWKGLFGGGPLGADMSGTSPQRAQIDPRAVAEAPSFQGAGGGGGGPHFTQTSLMGGPPISALDLSGHYTPTTGNARGATYVPGSPGAGISPNARAQAPEHPAIKMARHIYAAGHAAGRKAAAPGIVDPEIVARSRTTNEAIPFGSEGGGMGSSVVGYQGGGGVMGSSPVMNAGGYTPQGEGVTGQTSQGRGMGFGDLFGGGDRAGFASGGLSSTADPFLAEITASMPQASGGGGGHGPPAPPPPAPQPAAGGDPTKGLGDSLGKLGDAAKKFMGPSGGQQTTPQYLSPADQANLPNFTPADTSAIDTGMSGSVFDGLQDSDLGFKSGGGVGLGSLRGGFSDGGAPDAADAPSGFDQAVTGAAPVAGGLGTAAALRNHLMNTYGLTKDQATGFAGTLGYESGDFKTLQEQAPVGGGRGGYGWAQWTGPRRTDFENFAKQNNLDPSSPEANQGFLDQELHGKYAGALDEIRKTGSVADAAKATLVHYEGMPDTPEIRAQGGIPATQGHIDRALAYDKALGGSGTDVANIPSGSATPAEADTSSYGGGFLLPGPGQGGPPPGQLDRSNLQAPTMGDELKHDPGGYLMSVGAAMMASRSPWLGVGIGEGLVAGNKYLQEQKELEKSWGSTQAQINNLSQEAREHGADADLKAQQLQIGALNMKLYMAVLRQKGLLGGGSTSDGSAPSGPTGGAAAPSTGLTPLTSLGGAKAPSGAPSDPSAPSGAAPAGAAPASTIPDLNQDPAYQAAVAKIALGKRQNIARAGIGDDLIAEGEAERDAAKANWEKTAGPIEKGQETATGAAATQRGEENEQVADRTGGLQTEVQSLEALRELLKRVPTGWATTNFADAQNALATFGIHVGNPAEIREFVKYTTSDIWNNLKEQKGAVRNKEMDAASKMNVDPDAPPAANAEILAKQLGLARLQLGYAKDYRDWDKKTPNTASPTGFKTDWMLKNDLNKYVANERKNIAYVGQPIPEKGKLAPGQLYRLPNGKFGRAKDANTLTYEE